MNDSYRCKPPIGLVAVRVTNILGQCHFPDYTLNEIIHIVDMYIDASIQEFQTYEALIGNKTESLVVLPFPLCSFLYI